MASDETRRAISLDPRPRGAVRSLLVLDPSLLQWLAGRGWPSSHWAATEKSKSCLEAQPMVSVRHSRLQSTWRGSQMSLRDDMRLGLQKGKWGAGGLRGTCSSHSKQASKQAHLQKENQPTDWDRRAGAKVPPPPRTPSRKSVAPGHLPVGGH